LIAPNKYAALMGNGILNCPPPVLAGGKLRTYATTAATSASVICA
jgi:hypothetical protein